MIGPVLAELSSSLERTGAFVPDATDPNPTLVVALSGGLDSCVLLHALRFGLGLDPVVAHFDHRMRPDSGNDAAWVRGVCRSWRVALVEEVASGGLSSEDDARSARYAFLEGVRAARTPARVLTAHHADDQAETVLFRVLRGTGLDGLAAIPETREPGLVRPLLGVWREELEAYAEAERIAWRDDPTNEESMFARSAVRNELLPLAERRVHPGSRRALVRLAELARDEAEAWDAALDVLIDRLDPRREPVEGRTERPEAGSGEWPRTESLVVSVDRSALLAYPPVLRARVLRRLVRSTFAVTLDRSTTDRAVAFTETPRGGRFIELGAGVQVGRAARRIVVRGEAVPGGSRPDDPPREPTS